MQIFFLLGALFLSQAVNADVSLGDAADGLYQPVAGLTMLMQWACYVIGGALCIGAIMQFRIHFQSPKLTPLFTPVLMLLTGLAIVLLPYVSTLGGDSWNAESQDERTLSTYKTYIQDSQNPDQNQSGGHWSTQPQYQTAPSQ